MPNDLTPVLTVPEVARMLRVSSYAVYEAVRRNELPHVRVGRRLLFSREAIEHFLASGSVEFQ